jgi:DNA polymerase-3 subunit beta
MYFEISRKDLLNPLKMLTGVVEQRQTLPILSMALVKVTQDKLHLTANDSEIEIACSLPIDTGLDSSQEGEITLPARKFYDICRSFSDYATIQVQTTEPNKALVKSGKSRFSLACLPAEDFPNSPDLEALRVFRLSQRVLKKMLKQTSFSAATADVRYYLNGVCFHLQQGTLNLVATDGHRLALTQESITVDAIETEDASEESTDIEETTTDDFQVIVPKKAVAELASLLTDSDDEIEISSDDRHIKFVFSENLTLVSKLIDGRFPDYAVVIPAHADKLAVAQCSQLKQSLSQAAILSNEKFKGVRLAFSENLLTISGRNPEQEESIIECEVEYNNESFEIGFNVQYLLDVLNVIATDEIELHFTDSNSSVLITNRRQDDSKFVVMPMRL